jgi:hypothetical protein
MVLLCLLIFKKYKIFFLSTHQVIVRIIDKQILSSWMQSESELYDLKLLIKFVTFYFVSIELKI